MNEAEDLVGGISVMQERERAERISRVLERNYRYYLHSISEEGPT